MQQATKSAHYYSNAIGREWRNDKAALYIARIRADTCFAILFRTSCKCEHHGLWDIFRGSMYWQLYVHYFAQIVCTMTFRTRKFVITAHAITIVMCTFCRLLHEFHNLCGQDKPGWGRANSHANCGNSHANCVRIPKANTISHEFPNKFALWNSKRQGMAITLQSQWGFRSNLKYPTGNSNMNWNKPKDPLL